MHADPSCKLIFFFVEPFFVELLVLLHISQVFFFDLRLQLSEFKDYLTAQGKNCVKDPKKAQEAAVDELSCNHHKEAVHFAFSSYL